MDKKNTTIGLVVLLAAFAAIYIGGKNRPPPPPPPAPVTQTGTASPLEPGTTPAGVAGNPIVSATTLPQAPSSLFATVAKESTEARVVTLGNDFIEVRFTDFGGAIKDVAFKKHMAVKGRPEPYIFNGVHADPILAFTQDSFPGLDRSVRYELVSKSDTEIVFRAVFENRIEVLRRYSIVPGEGTKNKTDPYRIAHESTFRNLSDQTVALPRVALSLGTASLLDVHDLGQYLNTGYNNGKDVKFIERGDLEGRGFLGFGTPQPVSAVETPGAMLWGAVTNQFFASILTPDEAGVGIVTRRIELPPFPGTTQQAMVGLTGAMRFDLKPLVSRSEARVAMALYVGPKEYTRLANADIFKHDEEKVMAYTHFFFNRMFLSGIFAPLMNHLMTWTASLVHNWGLAIILGTLLIKIVTLPLTLMSAKSMKRMQKLAPEIKAIQEKYKDNPQKRGEATMLLYKERGVNPAGGCIPMLIPMPFFFGFFAMLPSASELRFSEFLWVKDLAQPDTIGHILGFPINALPLVLGATMIFQMRLMPAPSADNEQAVMMGKMMKWMPLFYVFVAYTMSCALSLYSITNGLFTIVQQLYINRMKDPDPVVKPVSAVKTDSGKRPTKNVTPPKKKG